MRIGQEQNGGTMYTYSANSTITPNGPLVVSETIDGEAIIMHHGSGTYFNTTGSGALIWGAIERTTTLDIIAAHLVAVYDVDTERALAATRHYLAALAAHDLIKPGSEAFADLPKASPHREPFREPELGVHTDLADMLLLDPIHDVGEAGWPAPKPQCGGI
jgi:Coenzyme PQQ synthesis protein D (PqqD)